MLDHRPMARLGVDVGGTFTDVVLEAGPRRVTTKVLTTPKAPEASVLAGIHSVLQEAELAPRDIALIVHGTTLATNALIERKGAKTALVTTEGFRDTIEIRQENRFEQYDLSIDLPPPLVPRRHRFVVRERIGASGQVITPLATDGVEAVAALIEREDIEAVAIGFLHSYINSAHERQAAEILRRRLPDLPITLSGEISPEMREYERFSTACANAYVQPVIGRYLRRLERELSATGFTSPLFLMTSAGGLMAVDTAIRFPVRLVESGPAGGAIFASHIAAIGSLDKVLSFDMGGTTAKICLIDNGTPQTNRVFEVARMYRFKKGSGLPLRIPVIEMVEIGAGGGSIARVDALGRVAVGPESAGAEPGPACYGQGGGAPTVTDADLVLGRVNPETFSGGRLKLYGDAANRSIARDIGAPLDLPPALAALAISEMVDENMANAARVHAIESGKNVSERTLIAFGGAAPLHAARIAEKLGISHVLVPRNAGVGSAIGFLRAPIAYEIVRSRLQRLGNFDAGAANRLFAEMRAEAEPIVRRGAGDDALVEGRAAFMRYRGQGHEIRVPIPTREFGDSDGETLAAAFEAAYRRLYSRVVPGVEPEVVSWVMVLGTPPKAQHESPVAIRDHAPPPLGRRLLFDSVQGKFVDAGLYWRPDLEPGARISGPAVIAEDETNTLVSEAFEAIINCFGYIDLRRKKD